MNFFLSATVVLISFDRFMYYFCFSTDNVQTASTQVVLNRSYCNFHVHKSNLTQGFVKFQERGGTLLSIQMEQIIQSRATIVNKKNLYHLMSHKHTYKIFSFNNKLYYTRKNWNKPRGSQFVVHFIRMKADQWTNW